MTYGEGGVVPTGTTNSGMAAAVDSGIAEAAKDPVAEQKELDEVKRHWEQYQEAREFDLEARKQYVIDRRYASGRADLSWASDANYIGAFIDILVSFLYAKDPDVSSRPAKKVQARTPLEAIAPGPALLDPALAAPPMPGAPVPPVAAPAVPGMPAPPMGGVAPIPGMPGGVPAPMPGAAGAPSQDALDSSAFAETAELVVSRLWKDAGLKAEARKFVRSALSVGPGWFKALVFSEKKIDPVVERSIQDMKQQLEQIKAAQVAIADPMDDGKTPEEKQCELEYAIQGAQANLEKIIREGLTVDFTRAEDMQVSLDVACLSDYKKADWVSQAIHVPKSQLRERFPRLTAEDAKTATVYVQSNPKLNQAPDGLRNEGDGEGTFTRAGSDGGGDGTKKVQFARVVEMWHKRDGLIFTMVDGIKRWAREPYAPPQATKRFYPFFYLGLFEVDGERHAQSLSWRLRKLQDEFASCRSGQRKTRERSIPGTVFNAAQLSETEVAKLEKSEHMEMVGIKPTNQDMPLDKLIVAKPVPVVDPRLWDTTSIREDMAVISGVQEALQSGNNPEQTATEAQIQQSGFASRTSADRDTLEDVLIELAGYTLEAAIQDVSPDYAQRVAGPAAFWPHGMDVQDILTLVEIDIEAGSTGKPNADAQRDAWATMLPLIKEVMLQVRQFEATDPPLAEALKNLLRETARRLDDRLDIDKFIPMGPPPLVPPMPMGAGGEAGAGTAPNNEPTAPGTPPGAPLM